MTSISIVISVYNVEQFIAACLNSIIEQTYTGPMECLIIDDCGNDDSMRIAEEIVNSYNGGINFYILHHEHNRGLSAARNTGMAAATGDYICFVDSDDELPPNSIEQLVEALDDGQYDIVVGDIKTIGNDALHEYLRMKLDDGTVLRDGDIILHYKTHWNMMTQAKLYKASFLRQQHITFKEGLIHEDELWSFQIACVANTLKAVQRTTYIYYKREGSITSISDKNQRLKIEALKIITIGMAQFLRSRKIFNPAAYTIMQKYVENILHFEKADRQRFRQAYLLLRKDTRFPLLYRIRAKGANVRECIKELHYYLPATIGERYKYARMTRSTQGLMQEIH